MNSITVNSIAITVTGATIDGVTVRGDTISVSGRLLPTAECSPYQRVKGERMEPDAAVAHNRTDSCIVGATESPMHLGVHPVALGRIVPIGDG